MKTNTQASGFVFRSTSAFLYLAAIVCSTIMFSIHAYLLAAFRVSGLPITKYLPAASGISGSAILGLVLLGVLAILLDATYIGAFTYVAWANRLGSGRCSKEGTTLISGSGIVGSLGKNQADGLPNTTTACRLETTSLVISGLISVIFMLHIPATIFAVRHQRYFANPQQNQNHIRKSFCRFWKYKVSHTKHVPIDKINPDALPKHVTPTEISEFYTVQADPEPPLKYSASKMAVKDDTSYADITQAPRSSCQVARIANGLATSTSAR
ncbi:BgTH12-02255 [Blumeria graminis f. sp. triticale]|uniref:Uncharacterized protein n=4 Tax=Blumeria graminis TaxID=34373 RepID=A0A656KFC5_BLUGR|nr:hypothetical protein BGT96224_590 [Blumeria graminis f. sp. tritici 96224]CAD6502012.1 BgTH12-02255 [Blumeria graminis f. sp. triticale]VDB85974.1 Bgt-590 [Blumeria graminis f. sp. tritici]